MSRRPRLLVATHSDHKLRELRELLRLERADLVSLDEFGIADDPIEDGTTFETNAAIKARFGANATGLPTLADDSGLEVDALGGGPGVRTRRYAGEHATDLDNNAKLLGELAGLPPERRGARYVCVLAFARPDGRGPRGGLPLIYARGTVRGRIAREPRGPAGSDTTRSSSRRPSHRAAGRSGCGRRLRRMRSRTVRGPRDGWHRASPPSGSRATGGDRSDLRLLWRQPGHRPGLHGGGHRGRGAACPTRIGIVYGGGRVGLMGGLADGALAGAAR